MQFKYPELLWALFLLLIPIFIHLFQLRRFKKTPFTNVALLQKVVSNSRRSSTLKKWLLLFTRLLLLAALVLAFAQPFFAEKKALKKKETVIYLDDSFSMQAKSENSTLLQQAIQELILSMPEDGTFDLFTNGQVFENVTIGDIRNELLALPHSSKQLSMDEIELKAETLFEDSNDTDKELILISDFQGRLGAIKNDSLSRAEKYFVKMMPETLGNIALDSVYIDNERPEKMELTVMISGNSENKNIPVSLFNGDRLIAKTAVELGENNKGTLSFTLPDNEVIDGRLEISDAGLGYDNTLYFNLNKKEKINVLAIGSEDVKFLQKIFTQEEFNFRSTSINTLNYSDIESQNLLILNELKNIPVSLQTSLKSFRSNGGSLVIIPSNEVDLGSYNQLLTGVSNTTFIQQVNYERSITGIDFSSGLYQGVFEKAVDNFQYPMVKNFNRVKTTAPSILSYQDQAPFLVGSNGVYIFTASITNGNSNFKSSPLIVPTFYVMGVKSLQLPEPYALIGTSKTIDVPVELAKDDILKLTGVDFEFIPRQQSFSNKVSLNFIENPSEAGIFAISDRQRVYRNVSFNFPRTESDLSYLDLEAIDSEHRPASISNLFDGLQKARAITELWKWFVILALVFLLVEILIQKFL